MDINIESTQELIQRINLRTGIFHQESIIQELDVSTHNALSKIQSQEDKNTLEKLAMTLGKRIGLIEARTIGASVILSGLVLAAGVLLKQESIAVGLAIASMGGGIVAFRRIEDTYGKFSRHLSQEIDKVQLAK